MGRSGRWLGGIGLGAGLLILLTLLAPASSQAGLSAPDAQSTPTAVATPTTVPFLHPPFAGSYRITSYVDHQFPTYEWDDTLVVFSGSQASAIDGIADRLPTFRGGYWLDDMASYVYYDGHNGVDYGTGAGTTILAAAPGEVVYAGSTPSSCDSPLQYVCIKHEGGYRTFYLHLEGIAVNKGEWVEAGDPVGVSGNSGCSLAAHLHFATEYNNKITDPYGWQPEGRPDPLVEYSGEQATWLWLPEEPPLPTGELTQPPRNVKTNGVLEVVYVPDAESPPVAGVAFWARYNESWHHVGSDETPGDGWQVAWDTRNAPEGEAWLHAWAVGTDGRVSKGSRIRTDITVDRHPPVGYTVGLEAGSTVGGHLWLYAASYDPASTTAGVTFVVRQAGTETWREIGEATWIHTANWQFEWDADVPDGTVLDVAARLTDGAGNATLTQAVRGIVVDRSMPSGELLNPASSMPVTTTLDLVFAPFAASTSRSIQRIAFHVWHDGAWHEAGEDRQGEDGWSVRWEPALVEDQGRLRIQGRAYDVQGRVNTALPQVTALTLDRTPPDAGYIRPRTGGVARPDVPLRVWAWDGGSGVERVEFYVNEGSGWLKVGEDSNGADGWSLPWEAREIADGQVAFSARVYDRAGNSEWTEDEVDVSLDRMPPEGGFRFPLTGAQLGGTITLTLDVTDTVSGLDRAIFYAHYDGRWHHLGADPEYEDGFGVAWDASAAGQRDQVVLTAWVYDRAGNYVELPHLEGISITDNPTPTLHVLPQVPTAPPPSSTPTDTPIPVAVSATQTPTDTPSPFVPRDTPSPTPTAMSSDLSTGTPAPSATPTDALPATAFAALTATPVSAVLPAPLVPPVHPAFWYLIGSGAVIATVLLVLSLRDMVTRRLP